MVEAVWGEHKTADQISTILRSFAAAGELGLVTRVDPEKAARVREALPAVELHADAGCLTLGALPAEPSPPAEVVVLSGGSSDRKVVAEISLALRCHGVGVDPVMDVGVAGLHRLLDQLPRLAAARILIACAGMEGALPTVLALSLIHI